MAKKNKKKEISEEDRAFLEKYARKVVRRRMEVPAVFFLESMKPLTFVGSQMMISLEPFATVIVDRKDYNRVQQLLENRDNVEVFIRQIEDLAAARENGEKI